MGSKRKIEQVRSDADGTDDFFDENSNLFTSNMNHVNNEVSLYKSKLKSIKNSLVDLPSYKTQSQKVSDLQNYKSVFLPLPLQPSRSSFSTFNDKG